MKKTFLFLAIVFVIALVYFFLNFKGRQQPTTASSNSASVASFEDWNLGEKYNLDITGGLAAIDNVTEASHPVESCTTTGIGDTSNLNDGDTSTFITLNNSDNPPDLDFGARTGDSFNCTIDPTLKVSKIRVYNFEDQSSLDQGVVDYQDSSDVWHNSVLDFGSGGAGARWRELTISPAANIKQIRGTNKTPTDEPTGFIKVGEVQILSTGYATHKSTLDGGDNFFEWESFTPTQTVPANTTVTYRYRTSPDGSTWSSWVSDIASVTSRSGDTKYRYLQVEATLTNTDGTSTPTIDSYAIGYHTNLAPSTPTAMTAVVGE